MQSKVREANGEFICIKHNKKVLQLIIQDDQISFLDAFLCPDCIHNQPLNMKNVISLTEALRMNEEKYTNLNGKNQARKYQLQKALEVFTQNIRDICLQFTENINEIQRTISKFIQVLENQGKRSGPYNLMQELEQSYLNREFNYFNEDLLERLKRIYLKKIDKPLQKLIFFDKLQKCQENLKNLERQEATHFEDSNYIPDEIGLFKCQFIKKVNPLNQRDSFQSKEHHSDLEVQQQSIPKLKEEVDIFSRQYIKNPVNIFSRFQPNNPIQPLNQNQLCALKNKIKIISIEPKIIHSYDDDRTLSDTQSLQQYPLLEK